MNKSAIKNFAVSSRKKLIEQVMQKAFQIGITAKGISDLKQEAGHIILNNIPQEKGFKLQRGKLIKEIEQKGYDQIMEEVAYTWFNRFIALRFMEVNDYLPTGVRVLSSLDPNRAEPDIIREALNVDLAVDQTVIYDFQDRNDSDGLFKYLLIHQCNDLNKIFPFMFETIADYTELLFPSNLLQEGSVIRDLVTSIPEEDWKEVEIIGWLYQYYISEKKDEVFADLKKNIKISKENIPAATQLFTPKWIVQYMVENSLGRLWLESHPNDELKAQWKYYLEEAEQEPEVQKQLEALKNPNLNPLDIKALDPCCGSGHILVYAFEVLYEIYKSHGYMEENIPKLILENNLYGLDIDDRAAQLASFAVMMKARSKSRGVFRENIRLNICAIQESKWMGDEVREILVDREAMELEQNRERDLITYLADTFKNAKEYGSILDVRELDLEFLEQRLDEVSNSVARDLLEVPYRDIIIEKLFGIILQAKIMGAKYEVVCTNPPYMGNKSMSDNMSEYLKDEFDDLKMDMFAVVVARCIDITKDNGHLGFMTPFVWMFIASFEGLRNKMLANCDISSLVQLEYSGFDGATVPICTFTLRKFKIDVLGEYVKLSAFKGSENQPLRALEAVNNPKCGFRYSVKTSSYNEIPGKIIAYWASEHFISLFHKHKAIGDLFLSKKGMTTGDNDRFLRMWSEVEIDKIKNKFQYYNKGGGFRRWYGNGEIVINWGENGEPLRNFKSATMRNKSLYFKKALTWGLITSSSFSARAINDEYVIGDAGPICVCDEPSYCFVLAYLNCKVASYIMDIINPTMNFSSGVIAILPYISITELANDKIMLINDLTEKNVESCKIDWDNFETSWDFKNHPFVSGIYHGPIYMKNGRLKDIYSAWKKFTTTNFNQLKANEEELNRIFIDIYGLQEELTPEVEDKDITIRKADQSRDIKSFISYAVGCMLGRYSLDEEGLILAGGKFNPERYKTFNADDDGILPVLSEAYFEDDIVTQFVEFVKVTFGENTLATNLDYIAETLARKANESSRECIRRYFLKDF